MKLTTRSRYGVRMMLEIALHYESGPVYLKDVAKLQEISFKYLSKLAIPLKAAGLIYSVRGSKGGYMLSKHPSQITLRNIVEVLEGGLSVVDCVENPENCKKYNVCVTRNVWKKIDESVITLLDGITLQDLVDQYNEINGELIYEI